jgi:hypothetical protein
VVGRIANICLAVNLFIDGIIALRNAVDMMKALKLPFTELPVQIKLADDEAETPKKGK